MGALSRGLPTLAGMQGFLQLFPPLTLKFIPELSGFLTVKHPFIGGIKMQGDVAVMSSVILRIRSTLICS
jgi:hypothetical protein